MRVYENRGEERERGDYLDLRGMKRQEGEKCITRSSIICVLLQT
jgi:hypothetical protein